MKKTIINAFFIVLALLSGISLFILKYQVKEEEKLLKTIHREILQNKREIHMLEAEWAHLNDPQRLMELVKSQTKWETISAKQISMLSDIPLKPAVLPEAPEVIETEQEKTLPAEKKVVQEIVPMALSASSNKEKVNAEQPVGAPTLGVAKNQSPKTPEKPVVRGSVKNGVWTPVNKKPLKPVAAPKPVAVSKPAATPKLQAPVKGNSKPVVKSNTASQSDSLKKGTSALSTLLNKGGKKR